MADLIHLVRHGDVLNPDGLVYGRLEGFGLSPMGLRQAEAAAEHLGGRAVVAVYSSPLDRARQTAEPIAARHGLSVEIVPQLTEWGLSERWQGAGWGELGRRFPGELEAYWERPTELAFSPESLHQVAERMSQAIVALQERHRHGEVVVTGHQDPIQAARLQLTGRPLRLLQEDKPLHAGIISLRPRSPWREVDSWSPFSVRS